MSIASAVRRTVVRASLPLTILTAVIVGPAAVTGCSGGGGDKATAPAANPCAEASFDSSAGIGFALGCNSVNVSVTGITYDQFSRRTAYNYDISCSDGSKRKTGRVYNVTYNSIGQALTWDYTVNGATCRKS